MHPRLLALKSAVPPYVIAQAEAARYARSLFAEVRDIARLIPVFENTGIQRRYSCVPIEWFLEPHGWVDRTRLYRLNPYIGRWSMVDIYVGALSVALVQLRPFAEIQPGPGAVYFGAVVILTMLASESFDPRLIWDAVDDRHE